ncbi:DUF5658 family protein [Kaarinaea lacus]
MLDTREFSTYPDTKVCTRANGYEDRRRNNFRTALHSVYRNRRSGTRRIDDSKVCAYVDVHEPWLVYLAMSALVLSTFDAYFTLALLKYGSQELNPFMNYFLQIDEQLFFLVKFLMTAVCVVFMVTHKNFTFLKYFNGYHLLYLSVSMYGLLVSYELFMLINLDFFQHLSYAVL